MDTPFRSDLKDQCTRNRFKLLKSLGGRSANTTPVRPRKYFSGDRQAIRLIYLPAKRSCKPQPAKTSVQKGKKMHSDRFLKLCLTIGAASILTLPAGAVTASFNAPAAFAAGTSPTAIAVGDFNGDGFADLAVTNSSNSSQVTIMLGSGNGTFTTLSNYTVGSSPVAAAVGDFNGDGKLDLAVVNYGSNSVSVLLGTGTGDFQAALNFVVGRSPYALALGDF